MKKRKTIYTVCIILICCSLTAVVGIHLYNHAKEKQRFSDIEVVNRTSADRNYYTYLSEMEDNCTIIVEGKVGKVLGQEVSTRYDLVLQKEVPGAGYTNHEFLVTKVHAGNVKVGDKISVSQQYFIWDYDDGSKQLISSSAVKPLEKGETYLLFLVYSEARKSYASVCDFQGIYPIEELQSNISAKNITQADLSYVYQVTEWENLIPIYEEVRNKYFSKK